MLKRFFNKLSGDEKQANRRLEKPQDLAVNDIIVFKPRSILPEDLEGSTFTVKRVSTYQYSDGMQSEFSLESSSGRIFSMSVEDGDDEEALCLSRKLSHAEITALFDEDELAGLWHDEFVNLRVGRTNIQDEKLLSWLPSRYRQTIQDGVGFFYKEDRRETGISQYVDDGSEEFRYHECEGDDDSFSLTVEIWEDGETDIYAQVYVPLNVIEEMWPHGD